MHSHLHTAYNINCEDIMTALDECHAKGFLHKALGNCNDIKRDVNKCLAGERYERAKRNRDDAREKRRRIEKIWAEERAVATGVPQGDAAGAAAGAKQ
ncbi:cytochrome c oxidase biogenesis protein Cmc1 like-domain-containing protein [Aspergillus karnatakaensis]|uniref:COX assembly mitochondrial protein n=1 Tax=Aspergillus karnatakaensis TaxID=1810916 RepID=UPI003CCD7E53